MSNIWGCTLQQDNSNLAVTLATVKSQLSLSYSYTDDDDYITSLIGVAQSHCEDIMQRPIFNKTYLLTLDYFPYPYAVNTFFPNDRGGWYAPQYWRRFAIKLPYPRVQSITSITYVDTNNVVQTVNPALYYLDNNQDIARVSPIYGQYWPYTSTAQSASIKITYVSGTWGDGVTVNTTPFPVKHAIAMLVANHYQNREAAMTMPLKEVDFSVNALLNSYKVETMFEEN